MEIEFGAIEGIQPGHWFKDRMEMRVMGAHRKHGSGMDWDAVQGTAAIVLSGGYKDDEDFGDEIIYTGQGGLNEDRSAFVKDQDWAYAGNKGLITAEIQGLPVRVFRGASHHSEWSPEKGYIYAGLYQVETHFPGSTANGFNICRFKLVRIDEEEVGIFVPEEGDEPNTGKRSKVVSYRIIRDTVMSRNLKELYNHTCQICDERITINSIGYSEGAHIKPLGKPHYGKDKRSNLLCLCPNHHVIFDKGGFFINDDFTLSTGGRLTVHSGHKIDIENIRYHRDNIYLNS